MKRKISLSFQILISFVFIPIISVMVVASAYFSFSTAKRNQHDLICNSTKTILRLNTSYLNERLNNMLAVMMNILNTPELKNYLREMDDGHPSEESAIQLMRMLNQHYSRAYAYLDAVAIAFKDHPDISFSASFHNVQGVRPNWDANPYEITWRDDGFDSPILTGIDYRETAGVSMIRVSDKGHVYGIFLDFRDSMLSNAVASLQDQMGTDVVLVGSYTSKTYGTAENLITKGIVNRISSEPGKNGWFDSGKKLVVWDTMNMTKWRLAVVFGETQLQKGLDAIKRVYVVVTLVIILISVVLALLFAALIARPLTVFSHEVASVDLDRLQNVDFSHTRSVTPEIRRLQESLNAFISRMKQWQKENTRMHHSLLLSQINPHFLYNTLYAIMQECDLGEIKEASNMLSDLSSFFRLGLNAGKEIVPLRDEIAHTTSYLKLIARSFAYSLSWHFDIPDELLDCLVPRMTLQPLVENSYQHGIRKRRGDGDIIVSAEKEDDHLAIKIKDNGIGMDEATLQTFKENLRVPPKSNHGFGTYNVNQRIHGLFGSPYGIQVESAPDAGTTITIVLPFETEEQE